MRTFSDMTKGMRRALIVESLIGAVQSNQITNRERELVVWLLAANGWELNDRTVMLQDLRDRVLKCCPTLRDSSSAALEPASTTADRTKGRPAADMKSFGLTPDNDDQEQQT
jgi:hypothetical protein